MHSISSGAGERKAMGGYVPQYAIAAELILSALRDRTLRWIRVADPKAGSVDDIIIGREERVDAYQVKWSETRPYISWRDFIHTSNDKFSLLEQLVDGWKKLKEEHTGKRIVVHLSTNRHPSASDRGIPVDESNSPPSRSFDAFIKQVWEPLHKSLLSGSTFDIPSHWQEAWSELQKVTGLSNEELLEFIKDCELEFALRRPSEETAPKDKDQEIFFKDLNDLACFLAKTVAAPEWVVELSRNELLQRMGWLDRFKPRSRHEFPVKSTYYPIKENVLQLEQALARLPGGYIGVLGSPGSGKSTFLTETLRYRKKERVIRYYAYVPDDMSSKRLRGEATNFLHDIVLNLEEAGFITGKSRSNFDRDQLAIRFLKQLRMLGDDWKQKGRKTIILVDGLDYVENVLELKESSLLRDLPSPDQVPEGVYVVLGTQTEQLETLNSEVKAILESDRRIEMKPLPKVAMNEIINKWNLPEALNDEQREQVYKLADGHPLALNYILNHLQEAVSTEDADDILADTEKYTGDIRQYYLARFNKMDTELINLLGILARLRVPIDLHWVNSYVNGDAIARLRQSLYYLFKRESNNRWYFFHNSFRQFLIGKTAEPYPGGGFDEITDREWHNRIAEACSQSDSPWLWEELFHRFHAQDHQRVLELSSQEYYRNQLFQFRPLEVIAEDIQLALRSAVNQYDTLALTRLILAGTELFQRQSNLKDNIPMELFLDIGENQTALNLIREGNRLLIDEELALRVSRKLLEKEEFEEEARRLFDMAEPLDHLRGVKSVDNTGGKKESDLLSTWARTAVEFRDISKVVECTRRVRVAPHHPSESESEEDNRQFQNNMLYEVGNRLIELLGWDDFTVVVDALDVTRKDDLHWWFWLHYNAWQSCIRDSPDRALGFLNKVIERIPSSSLGSVAKTAIAEGIYLILHNEAKAREWLEDVSQPELTINTSWDDTGLNRFIHRLRLNRLLAALGEDQPVTQIIPNASNSMHRGMVYFERAICRIASIWGKGLGGEILDPFEVIRQIGDLICIFNIDHHRLDYWYSWDYAKKRSDEFYGWLIAAVSWHGQEALQRLSGAFEQQWSNPETSKYWLTSTRRCILLDLYNNGISKDWISDQLEDLEKRIMDGGDASVYERIDECKAQAKAWVKLGELGRAKKMITLMLHNSLGIEYQEGYQLRVWVQWLGRVNEIEPERAAEPISWFTRALAASDSEGIGDALQELLAVTFRWSPRKAIALFMWLLERGKIWHEGAVSTFLKEALESPQIDTDLAEVTLSDFMLPLVISGYPEIAKRLVEKVAIYQGKSQATKLAGYLFHKVQTLAFPKTRHEWCNGIADGLQKLNVDIESIGIEPHHLESEKQESSHSPPSPLKLQDGEQLEEEEIKRRVSSLQDLRKLKEKQSADSYFSWWAIYEDLLEKSTKDEVIRLMAFLKEQDQLNWEHLLWRTTKRLLELGYVEEALSFGRKALKELPFFKWDARQIGEKIIVSKLLLKHDPQAARMLIFEQLVNDLGLKDWNTHNLAINLHEILPLLSDEIPVAKVWGEIEQYVHALFSSSPMLEESPEFLNEEYPQDTSSRALADLLVSHIGHPTIAVSKLAYQACAKLLLLESSHMVESISDALEGPESKQEYALMIIDTASLQNPNIALPFQEKIIRLFQSENFAIKQAVKAICERIGYESPKVFPGENNYQELPPVYRFVLQRGSPGRIIIPGEDYSAQPYPDSQDPVEVAQAFEFLLRAIHSETGIPLLNLAQRTTEIMKELSPREEWSADAEWALLDKLRSVGLRFGYRRPRATLARRAVFHVISELINAGALREVNINRLGRDLRWYDPFFLNIEPCSRPEGILVIPGREDFSNENDNWIQEVRESLELTRFRNNDDFVIIAEETRLKILDREKPRELRLSLVCDCSESTLPQNEHYSKFFVGLTNFYISEYPRLRIASKPTPIVIRHSSYFDDADEHWLALNPHVGFELGWHLDADGLFRWIDDDDKMMVESLWWSDGLYKHESEYLRDEVGEGWLVLASKEAFEQIVTRYKPLERRILAQREYGQWKEHRMERATDKRDIQY